MSTFITVPVVGKEDKTLEDLRLNVDSILRYRKWLNKESREQTVVFFGSTGEYKLIVDLPVERLDELINKCK
tara:strand:+ start:555 stop:770 length:216 start_codon:yes stop_codon:yes gene_type:complete